MSEDKMIPGGGIDTSLISVDSSLVDGDKGLVRETNMVFSLPPKVANGSDMSASQPGSNVAPVRGTVDEQALIAGLTKSIGAEAASKSATNIGNLFSAIQKTMSVVDSTHTGIKLDRKTNKPLIQLLPPVAVPVNGSIADLPVEQRKSATVITLK